jgi:hypothetical protein
VFAFIVAHLASLPDARVVRHVDGAANVAHTNFKAVANKDSFAAAAENLGRFETKIKTLHILRDHIKKPVTSPEYELPIR